MGQQVDQPEGTFASRGGLWVVAQAVALLGAFVIPYRFGTGLLDWRDPWWCSGSLLAVLGFALMIAGASSLGPSLTAFPRPLAQAQLRTGGPYRIVRHPIYAGILMASVGWALAQRSLAGLAFAVIVFLFFDRKSAFEEEFLRAQFPDYDSYRKRVRKLIPWVY